jgi:predicted metal-dependent TIM-barrel fold hydrolase
MKVIDDLMNSGIIERRASCLFIKERLLGMDINPCLVTGVRAVRILFNPNQSDDFMIESKIDVSFSENVPKGVFFYEVDYIDDFGDDYVREVSSSCRGKISA